ncbi:MAG: YiiD C-terminal domain-containing protein [Gammaproteobacteria bacterium]|nr:YiiD C-terminal domain-containing protein [Gammaproteobacteria bacterium]
MSGTPERFITLTANANTECPALVSYLHQHIPLTRDMQVNTAGLDVNGLALESPLAPNHNHQASAFGGSIASLAMLAGWGLVWLALDHGHGTTIVVRDVRLEYLRPVRDVFRAVCPLPTVKTWEKFMHTLDRRHKARLDLEIAILCGETVCARCSGRFVAYHSTRGNG